MGVPKQEHIRPHLPGGRHRAAYTAFDPIGVPMAHEDLFPAESEQALWGQVAASIAVAADAGQRQVGKLFRQRPGIPDHVPQVEQLIRLLPADHINHFGCVSVRIRKNQQFHQVHLPAFET